MNRGRGAIIDKINETKENMGAESGTLHINAGFFPFFIQKLRFPVPHQIGGNQKRFQQSTNADQN